MKMKSLAFQSIPSHAHCKVCGVSMPKGRSFCSNECSVKDEKGRNRGKKFNRFFLVVMVVLFVILIVVQFS
ncbi:MAG: DUF2116 family Zn-ribbon domain-containing protein [Thaumarchaeota archaeon]|nr:DUF2116 family Zn-ribbon domain-containing protein [Nitrososphaerota archaeon]